MGLFGQLLMAVVVKFNGSFAIHSRTLSSDFTRSDISVDFMFSFVFFTFMIVFNICAVIVNELLFEQTPELWRRPPGKCTPHVSITSLMTFDIPKRTGCLCYMEAREGTSES